MPCFRTPNKPIIVLTQALLWVVIRKRGGLGFFNRQYVLAWLRESNIMPFYYNVNVCVEHDLDVFVKISNIYNVTIFKVGKSQSNKGDKGRKIYQFVINLVVIVRETLKMFRVNLFSMGSIHCVLQLFNRCLLIYREKPYKLFFIRMKDKILFVFIHRHYIQENFRRASHLFNEFVEYFKTVPKNTIPSNTKFLWGKVIRENF